jgi:ABC-type spermidine/putrescine transport system permease subunit I
MRKLRRIHVYLGCFFGPTLIFVAVTGSWQLFALHRNNEDTSYIAPKLLKILSSIHQYQHLPATDPTRYTPLRFFVLAAAVGLVFTTILGFVMAFRFSRSPIPVFAALAAGVILPTALVLIYR